jgi:cytochrome c peroxidase
MRPFHAYGLKHEIISCFWDIFLRRIFKQPLGNMMRCRILCILILIGSHSVSVAEENTLPKADAVFSSFSASEVALGRLLFFDPILSGSRTVSCATCHHPNFATSDGLSLGIGDGGAGLGAGRKIDPDNIPEERIPRHSPTLFNLGASEFRSLFYDGRLEEDPDRPQGIRTPLGEDMVADFNSILSAQSMFPVLSADEMAGHYTESDVARAIRLGFLTGPDGAWELIANRVSAVPEYRRQFDNVIGADQPITFTAIANTIAAFIAMEWRADNSAFDQFLRTGARLDPAAKKGMFLFYGKAGCSRCHSGQFQTDHDFHAIAMPQFGPGKAARFENHARDIGRMRVTGRQQDAYKFRTPSLRNISDSAPYGHTGAFSTLKGVIRHHLDPVESLRAYSLPQAKLPHLPGAEDDWVLVRTAEIEAIATANELAPMSLASTEIDQLIAFLQTLSDPASLKGRLGIPSSVPSGLAVDQ